MKYLITILWAVLSSVAAFDENFNKTFDFIIKEINRDNISKYLRNLTVRPHLGGTEVEYGTAQMIADVWIEQGLDEVHMPSYDVLLSYPDNDAPNYVRIHDESEEVIWKSQGRSPPLKTPEESSPEVPPDFNAYSPPANISGDIIYVNFGKEEDFDRLPDLGINATGKIVLARYGKIFRGNIVKSAEQRGALGVILYSDPQQYAKEGEDSVYPNTVYMPGEAAAFGSAYISDGDPLTPFYPSIESAFRIPEEEALTPKIPVMPLGYNDARQIFQRMGGEAVPTDWQGGLNLTYKLGPGLEDNNWKVSMEVNTQNKRTTTYNVVGVIKGAVEPDRYILFGNHRDAWIFGAVDPSSGTAVMLELTRTLTEYMRQTGWVPRRSLVFISWGAEEYGVIGSTEWAEHFAKQLGNRAVAYLNIDMAIEGNHTLRTKSAPLLYKAAKDVTKLIPNPNPAEVAEGRNTVFDTWVYRTPDDKTPTEPALINIGSGSDYRGVQHTLGVPSLDYRYTHSKEMYAEPLYHTVYETFYLVSELYDKGFHFHASVAQMWGILGIYLADSQVLPLGVDDYASFILEAQQEFRKKFGSILEERNITLDHFISAGEKFDNVSKNFASIVSELDLTNPLAVRRINDQLMLVERAFLDPRGLPGRPAFNHVVTAPSAANSYAGTSFSGLTDALDKLEQLTPSEQESRIRTFQEHLAACTHFLLTASTVLSDDLW